MEQKRPRWWRVPFPVTALRCGFVLAVVFAPMTSPAPTMRVAPRRPTINHHLDVRIRKHPSLELGKVKKEPLLGDFHLPGERATMTDLERLRHSEPKPFPDVGASARPRNLKNDPFIDRAIQPPNEFRLDLADKEKVDTRDIRPITRDTIIVEPGQRPGPVALKRIEKLAGNFLARVPAAKMPNGPTDGITFVVVSRGSDESHYATICDGERTRTSGFFVGETVRIGSDVQPEMLANRLKELAVKGIVFAYGENDGGALEQASRTGGFDFVRRGTSLETDVLKSARRNAELADRSLDPAQIAFLNALPATKDGLTAMGFPIAGVEKWQDFHKGVEGRIEGIFETRLTSKKELLAELTSGNNDVVMIVAHNDGQTLFINGEELTTQELNELPQRVSASERPRVCILMSCETAKIRSWAPNRFLAFFGQERESLAEQLVKRKYFDRVIGADHEIQSEETLRVLDCIKSAEKVRDLKLPAGWLPLADLFRKLESEPI
jgi:hypothetical protein